MREESFYILVLAIYLLEEKEKRNRHRGLETIIRRPVIHL